MRPTGPTCDAVHVDVVAQLGAQRAQHGVGDRGGVEVGLGLDPHRAALQVKVDAVAQQGPLPRQPAAGHQGPHDRDLPKGEEDVLSDCITKK